jgi:Cell cycle protein
MNATIRRRLATLCCHALQKVLPTQLECWGWAISYEVADIPDDTEALLFALESLWSLVPRAIAARLFQGQTTSTANHAHPSGNMIDMGFLETAASRPRAFGVGCALASVGLGLLYMTMAGAPVSYVASNAVALILGLILLALLARSHPANQLWIGTAILVLAVGLLTTALVGNRVEGAARWLKLGPLYIQPSLILLPVMILGFARTRDKLSAAGLIVAAVAMAWQPDRAMAAMLVAGVVPLALMRPDRPTITALVGSVIGLCVTLVRPDNLPAMPFVDQILFSSFDVHMLAGLSVMAGTILLVVPALLGLLCDPAHRETYIVFAAIWITAIAAAALGNYPTPVVGYSGAAILGYALSLLMLPKAADLRRSKKAIIEGEDHNARFEGRSLRLDGAI